MTHVERPGLGLDCERDPGRRDRDAVDIAAASVRQRVAQWQPTEREKRWEGIGWAKDLRAAEGLAKEHHRPVFLFTLDGKMNVGRC